MDRIGRAIRAGGDFARRRDLLDQGFTDDDLRRALGNHTIFRVRQGWFAMPDAPAKAVAAVRVGGRLTGIAALETYGLRVPRRAGIDVVVPRSACRLRSPTDRADLLGADATVRVHWIGPAYAPSDAGPWRVSLDDALLFVISTEARDISVACCSAVMRFKRWPLGRMIKVFERGPLRVQAWLPLVGVLDDSHGETFVRLWLGDAGVRTESQPRVAGAGRLDFRVSPNVYVEVDGGQHDPNWTGENVSTYGPDHDRDTTVAIAGGTVLRYVYRQLYGDWPRCLVAIKRARDDDLELIARRAAHPFPPRTLRSKRRRLWL